MSDYGTGTYGGFGYEPGPGPGPGPLPIGLGKSPLEYAEEIRKYVADELAANAIGVPARTWSQLGGVTLECEALVASVLTTSSFELGGQACDAGQVATIVVAIARDCANVANEDGTTNIPAQLDVAAQQDADASVLWAIALSLDDYLVKTWTVDWAITGGLSITTLTLTTGVP